jgi:hypothetical protein
MTCTWFLGPLFEAISKAEILLAVYLLLEKSLGPCGENVLELRILRGMPSFLLGKIKHTSLVPFVFQAFETPFPLNSVVILKRRIIHLLPMQPSL